MPDGSLRMKVYYPASSLKRITCFTTKDNKSKDLPFYYKIKRLVEINKWNIQVIVKMV